MSATIRFRSISIVKQDDSEDELTVDARGFVFLDHDDSDHVEIIGEYESIPTAFEEIDWRYPVAFLRNDNQSITYTHRLREAVGEMRERDCVTVELAGDAA